MNFAYPYRSLPPDYIRLIQLLPGGDWSAPLSCQIESAQLSDQAEYEAVSYAWGKPVFDEPIEVKLQEPTDNEFNQPHCTIFVTNQLAQLLRRLRLTDAPRLLWVDGICINQLDTAERSAQVLIMRQIFARASRVVVWLGEASADGSSDRAIRFLELMATQAELDLNMVYDHPESSGSEAQGQTSNARRSEDGNANVQPDDESESGEAEGRSQASDGSESDDGDATEGQSLLPPPGPNTYPHEPWRPLTSLNYWQRLTRWFRRHGPPYRYYQRQRATGWKQWLADQKPDSRTSEHIQIGFPILHREFGDDRSRFYDDSFLADWHAIDALLARPWWSRTWIVQEVWSSGGKTVLQCGETMLEWKTFQAAMDYEDAWDDMGACMKGTLREAEWMHVKRRYGLALHLCKQRLRDSKLSDLLWNTWDRETTDPRDKVYAMLGLVSQSGAGTSVRPDYDKSMAQLYLEVSWDIIRHEDSLDILLAARASYSGCDNWLMPSWVPDWRREVNATRPQLFVNRERLISIYISGSMDWYTVTGHGYSACGRHRPSVSAIDESAVLCADAVLIDEIGLLDTPYGSGPRPAGPIVDSALDVVKRAVPRKWGFGGTRSDDNLRREVERVVIAGCMANLTFDEAVELTMMRRRFFVTENRGYLCIGPAAARRGDKIFILAGCNFPLVLRQTSTAADAEGEQYELVGEAYGK